MDAWVRTATYYTYIRAAVYLGMPFYAAVDAVKRHAEHSGIDLARYVNTLPLEAVEGIPTCEHCREYAREAA